MSIHKTKSGSFQVRWRVDGKLKARNFDKKIDAQQFEASLCLNVAHQGLWIKEAVDEHPASTFAEFVGIWLRDYGSVHSGLQGTLAKEGRLSAKTINNILGLAHKILNVAVQWEYLKQNPAEGIPQIRVPEQDFQFWTFEERDKFLSWAKTHDPELYDIIATAVYTGLRRGEMEALRRDCIDLERRFIIVKRSYCSSTRKFNEYTKSKKIRRVPMND